MDTSKEYVLKSGSSEKLSAQEKTTGINKNITAYQIDFTNKGGLVMPIILELTF